MYTVLCTECVPWRAFATWHIWCTKVHLRSSANTYSVMRDCMRDRASRPVKSRLRFWYGVVSTKDTNLRKQCLTAQAIQELRRPEHPRISNLQANPDGSCCGLPSQVCWIVGGPAGSRCRPSCRFSGDFAWRVNPADVIARFSSVHDRDDAVINSFDFQRYSTHHPPAKRPQAKGV